MVFFINITHCQSKTMLSQKIKILNMNMRRFSLNHLEHYKHQVFAILTAQKSLLCISSYVLLGRYCIALRLISAELGWKKSYLLSPRGNRVGRRPGLFTDWSLEYRARAWSRPFCCIQLLSDFFLGRIGIPCALIICDLVGGGSAIFALCVDSFAAAEDVSSSVLVTK